MPAQTNASLPEGLEVGGYRIVKKISSGGFSIVYLATDENGNSVAIKEYMPAALAQRKPGELSPYVAPENLNTYRIGLKCFFEEGRALASIYHPNIVRVINFFRSNDTVYMVMNYESGRSLQEHILRNRNKEQKDVLSERFVRRVFAQVMNGLREVHSNRLLHLDVKPANIYLRMDAHRSCSTSVRRADAAAGHQQDLSDVHTGIRGARALQARCRTRSLDRRVLDRLVHLRLHVRHAAAGVDQRLKEDKMPTALRSFRGLYSNQLISMVERCLRLNSLERPQTVYAVQKELLQNVPERPEFSVMERHRRSLAQHPGPLFAVHEGPQHHLVLTGAERCKPTFLRLK